MDVALPFGGACQHPLPKKSSAVYVKFGGVCSLWRWMSKKSAVDVVTLAVDVEFDGELRHTLPIFGGGERLGRARTLGT